MHRATHLFVCLSVCLSFRNPHDAILVLLSFPDDDEYRQFG